ncbi:Cyclin-L1 [Oryzias melastigma]|uniref:Cyclin-L1 n=1 Tax=Oryzias melastigma TaxID=30732 RepID=A0A834BYW9_ORYME|nr:Cyclin-L1 [Oryzias melastigma]
MSCIGRFTQSAFAERTDSCTVVTEICGAGSENRREQRRRRDEQLSQQERSEKENRAKILRESHHAALTKMKADYEIQLSTKIRDVREELHKEAELELEKEKEKNQFLLQQCQLENSQLQQKVQDLQEELRQERRRQEEERAQDEERKRREEESHQQEARELSHAKAELQQTSEKNAELIEEVMFLQETVRKECEEREELTAALCQAQQELFGQQSIGSHPGSSKHIPDPRERQPPSGHTGFQLQPEVSVPLTHSSNPPNTFRPSPAQTEKDRGLDPDKERATRRLENESREVLLGGEKRLPPNLKALCYGLPVPPSFRRGRLSRVCLLKMAADPLSVSSNASTNNEGILIGDKVYSEVFLTIDNSLVPDERLSTTPSMLDGLDLSTETDLRILGCELIQSAGILLRLPQVAMATGQVLFHRFFYSKSFVKHSFEIVAMASIYLASKIEEAPRRIRDVINVFHHLRQLRGKKTPSPLILDQNYINTKNQVIKAERRVLKELGFCVHVKHPHKLIVMYLQVLECEKNQPLVQTAWNYMNDSLRTNVFVRFQPETIACACIYLAARVLQIPLPSKPHWYLLFGANEDEIKEICVTTLRLYTRKKPNYEHLEKEFKKGSKDWKKQQKWKSFSIKNAIALKIPLSS